MPITLKGFNQGDPEPRLYTGLPVTPGRTADDTNDGEPHVLMQPNIPDRARRIAEAARRHSS